MSRFAEIAKKKLNGSPVLAGREKLSIEEVMGRYPDGVTVDEFDVLEGEKGVYPVFHIKGTANYFNGGSLAMKIVQGWIEAFGGDLENASKTLKEDGGCTFKVSPSRTRKGNPIVRYEVIE